MALHTGTLTSPGVTKVRGGDKARDEGKIFPISRAQEPQKKIGCMCPQGLQLKQTGKLSVVLILSPSVLGQAYLNTVQRSPCSAGEVQLLDQLEALPTGWGEVSEIMTAKNSDDRRASQCPRCYPRGHKFTGIYLQRACCGRAQALSQANAVANNHTQKHTTLEDPQPSISGTRSLVSLIPTLMDLHTHTPIYTCHMQGTHTYVHLLSCTVIPTHVFHIHVSMHNS